MVWDQNRFACTFNVVQGVALHPGLLGTGVTSLTGRCNLVRHYTKTYVARFMFIFHKVLTEWVQTKNILLDISDTLLLCPSSTVDRSSYLIADKGIGLFKKKETLWTLGIYLR